VIQIHTFRAPLDGKDLEDVAFHTSQRAHRIIEHRLELLGISCTVVDDVFELSLRVQGLDRWRIKQHAREFGTFLLAMQGLAFTKPLQPYSVVTEVNRRGLKADEGRVPRARPRAGQGRRHLKDT
jgi:hypothetical protein